MRARAIIAGLTTLLALGSARAAPLNLFEWSAVAPIVASGEVVGEDGGIREFHVRRTFRGSIEADRILRIDLREANRSRNLSARIKALRLDVGDSYVVLLEETPSRKEKKRSVFRLVRGVGGARALPAEGGEAVLDALAQFVAIQDLKSDSGTWRQFSRMLDGTNPIELEVALDQFLKFRRGEARLVPGLRPLLAHPIPDIRARSARLIGQIAAQGPPTALPESEALFADLVGRARRDDTVVVRVAATEALPSFRTSPVRTILEKIADEDEDQQVRYMAEKLLLDMDGLD